MIVIAPDKFKGTLTAEEAAHGILARMLGNTPDAVIWPMADGGEGTAAIIGRYLGLEYQIIQGKDALNYPKEIIFFADNYNSIAYMDSASSIGLQYLKKKYDKYNPWEASSCGLGDAVLSLFSLGYKKVVVGVGGTACCDGGMGIIEVMPKIPQDKQLVFLADVDVPLLPIYDGGLSGLTFMQQKGFSADDIPVMYNKLKNWIEISGGNNNWKYAGCGSGIGYAFTLLGANGYSGAEYILNLHLKTLQDNKIDMIITGEGRFDCQSLSGKVTGCIINEANRRGIECVIVAGCVDYSNLIIPDGVRLIDLSENKGSSYIPDYNETLDRMSRHRINLNLVK